MRTIVTGGLGFVGAALAERLRSDGAEVIVYDVAQGDDIRDQERLKALVRQGDAVFHLAGLRGAAAEQDFDLALAVNLDGSRALLEACRARGGVRFVFASTLAVFGAEPPEVDEQTRPSPLTTYGATKAAVELLVADYRRKGYVDGRVGRLPTVIVRPDAPALAASGFASALFRETLAGRDYDLPVNPEMHLFVIGVSTAAACLAGLAALPPAALGDDPVVNLPGLAVTAADLVDAARRAGATGTIRSRPDADIEAMVGSWPRTAKADRARALGLPGDDNLDAVVLEYLESAT